MMNTVWAVTCYKLGEDPIVTVFDNKQAAFKCYSYFLDTNYDKVNLDEVPIYKEFLYND